MTPPQISDRDGFPFRLLSRIPYRPANFCDWRFVVLSELRAKGLVVSHKDELPHD